MIRSMIAGRRGLLALALVATLAIAGSGLALAQTQEQEEALVRARRAQEEARARLHRLGPRIHARAPFLARALGEHMGISSADRVLRHAEELGLTDEQVDRVRVAETAHRRAEIERDAGIEIAELDLEGLMGDADSVDLGAVENKMMEIARLRVDGRVADLRLRQEIRSILTAEQREQLEEMGPRSFIIRSRGDDGEGGVMFRRRSEGDEGRYFFDGDGYSLRFGPEAWDFELDGDWFEDGHLFEALEPLHRFEFWRGHDLNR